MLEHIGPVQFNMGGIQVDADDMVQRLKVRPSRITRESCEVIANLVIGPPNLRLVT